MAIYVTKQNINTFKAHFIYGNVDGHKNALIQYTQQNEKNKDKYQNMEDIIDILKAVTKGNLETSSHIHI